MIPRHLRMAKAALWAGNRRVFGTVVAESRRQAKTRAARRQGQPSSDGLSQPLGFREAERSAGVLRSFIGTLEQIGTPAGSSHHWRDSKNRHRCRGDQRAVPLWRAAVVLAVLPTGGRDPTAPCQSDRRRRASAAALGLNGVSPDRPRLTSEYGGLRQQAHAGPRACKLRNGAMHVGYVAVPGRLVRSLSRVSPTTGVKLRGPEGAQRGPRQLQRRNPSTNDG